MGAYGDSMKEERIVRAAQPYGYSRMMRDLAALLRRYPFLSAETIGKSVLGKKIPALRMGFGSREIHYNGAMHANEWITALLLMRFAEQYAAAVSAGCPLYGYEAAKRFEETVLWIVPMVNPDGVDLVLQGAAAAPGREEQLRRWNGGSENFSVWKANVNGVDLNDQFPAHWEAERARRGVAGPGPRDYGGAEPLSEPEAAALEAFTRKRDFRLVMAFHTQGKEIYWNYRDCEPPEAEQLARRLGAASGYEPIKLAASDAGYKDWFIAEYRRPGFTVEAGLGSNPLPLDQFETIYRDVSGIMLEGLAIG